MQKLTKEQAIVITGFTGIMCTPSFGIFQEDVEKRLGRPVWAHEFATLDLKDYYKEDFLALVPDA